MQVKFQVITSLFDKLRDDTSLILLDMSAMPIEDVRDWLENNNGTIAVPIIILLDRNKCNINNLLKDIKAQIGLSYNVSGAIDLWKYMSGQTNKRLSEPVSEVYWSGLSKEEVDEIFKFVNDDEWENINDDTDPEIQ